VTVANKIVRIVDLFASQMQKVIVVLYKINQKQKIMAINEKFTFN